MEYYGAIARYSVKPLGLKSATFYNRTVIGSANRPEWRVVRVDPSLHYLLNLGDRLCLGDIRAKLLAASKKRVCVAIHERVGQKPSMQWFVCKTELERFVV
jgi:hypothetical protein